jgi:type IV pilus assembly protein PilV
MLGGHRRRRWRQNARVKKPSHPPSGLPRRATRSAGFTLIEVLIALIVLVLGVLGAAAMTLTSLRDGKQSIYRSQATALAYELGDLMRASPSQEAVFTGATPALVSSCWTTGCSPSDTAKNDVAEWRAKVPLVLPNGDAVICHDLTKLDQYPACDGSATAPLVVKLKWDEKNNNARGQTTSAVTTRSMSIVIQPNW